jgi:hypothetical protein
MDHIPLSQHKFHKGKFTAPLNELVTELGDTKSWSYGRLPEYFWIALILHKYERKEGLQRLGVIVKKLHEVAPDLRLPRLSDIFSLSNEQQILFYQELLKVVSKDTLSPLTLIYTYSIQPIFAETFVNVKKSIEDRIEIMISILEKATNHQSDFSTDIRFIVLYHVYSRGHLCFNKELEYHLDELKSYPQLEHDNPKMRKIRPFIRETELIFLEAEFVEINEQNITLFWETISKITECDLYAISYEDGTQNVNEYMERLYEIYGYLTDLFVRVSPLDNKMLVILGIATYSYKRLKEITDYKLQNTIVGRSSVRVLIENYIMLKYLLNLETTHPDVWKEFQEYGIGQYKLIVVKESSYPNIRQDSHVSYTYMGELINEFKIEEFRDMDTKYFDKIPIREKASKVDEKELYDLYYDYDSAFEHGLWGAIRESSLLKCNNPAHRYHCVPDINDEQKLKNVLPDCVMVMNKTVKLLDELYGIPNSLIKGVLDFEG